jgi:hypothetical protein
MSHNLITVLIVISVAVGARVISDGSHVHTPPAPSPAHASAEPVPASLPDLPRAPKDSPEPTVPSGSPSAPDGDSGPSSGPCADRADSAPVTFETLPGDTIGTAYLAPLCEIVIDPSVQEDGPEAVCTVLAHERAHLRGREHGGNGLMRAKLPEGYVAPQCESATANASDDSVFFRPASDGDGNGNVIPVPAVR